MSGLVTLTRRSRRAPGPAPANAARRCRGDGGVTLIELLVAMALMALIVPLTFPMLTETLRVGGNLASQSAGLDGLQIAAASVGYDARRASCLSLGPTGGTPGTEASGSTLVVVVERSGSAVTVTYEVSGGRLTRSEDGGTPIVVASGLTGNPAVFTLHPGARQALQLDMAAAVEGPIPVELHTTVTARAAWQPC
jgi:prepilin-type N-terminal cleavage/methylation domain-containing protein